MKRLPLLTLATSAAICLLCATAPAAPNIQQDDLGAVPAAEQITYVAMSPDCHDLAMVVPRDAGVELRVNGKSIATADEISTALYSPDSAHFAYVARKDKTWNVVLDGEESSAGARPASQLVFSADSGHLLYLAATTGGQAVVLDGKSQQSYRRIGSVQVSPAGLHYAYAALGNDNQWKVVRDGTETGQGYARGITRMGFSLDGLHLAYVGRDASREYVVERDDQRYGPYRDVSSTPTFSPDGNHLVFGAVRVKSGAEPVPGLGMPLEPLIVTDGSEEHIVSQSLVNRVYSSDGKHVLAVMMVPVANGMGPARPSMDGGSVGGCHYDLAMSPDGGRLAGVSLLGAITIDHRDYGLFPAVGPPLFSPDSRHAAYAAKDGVASEWSMHIDGDSEPGSLVVPTVDLDKGEWNPLTSAENQLSFDNGHAYNGQYPYHFDPDGTLVYFRIADGHLYRVHWKPDDATTLPTTRP